MLLEPQTGYKFSVFALFYLFGEDLVEVEEDVSEKEFH